MTSSWYVVCYLLNYYLLQFHLSLSLSICVLATIHVCVKLTSSLLTRLAANSPSWYQSWSLWGASFSNTPGTYSKRRTTCWESPTRSDEYRWPNTLRTGFGQHTDRVPSTGKWCEVMTVTRETRGWWGRERNINSMTSYGGSSKHLMVCTETKPGAGESDITVIIVPSKY